MQEFRKFLDEQKIYVHGSRSRRQTPTGSKSNIKAELFINEFGQQEGMMVHAENRS